MRTLELSPIPFEEGREPTPNPSQEGKEPTPSPSKEGNSKVQPIEVGNSEMQTSKKRKKPNPSPSKEGSFVEGNLRSTEPSPLPGREHALQSPLPGGNLGVGTATCAAQKTMI